MTTTSSPLRVALTTLGCKVNYAEMAELAGSLAAAGLDVIHEDEPADVRVLNSCTVTLQADATTRQRLSRLRRQDPASHLILTGCSVDANPQRYLLDDNKRRRVTTGVDAVFANPQKAQIAEYIVSLAEAPPVPAPTSASVRSRAFIKIQDGCDHRCTYCIVWRARGQSTSRPADEVKDAVVRAINDGHAEVVLTGVDLGGWGRDIGSRFHVLLEMLLDAVGTDARIRLSSINANDVTRELIGLNAHPQLCPHWHMPLQSGSDAILKAMHRGYRRAQYLRVAQELRQINAATEFTTDVMVAFPGETDSDHSDTIDIIERVGFLGCHVFRYSPRPDTPAATMETAVSAEQARHRSADARRAAAHARDLAYQRAVGQMHDVVWDQIDDGVAHGFTATYHEVAAPADGVSPGTLSRVHAVAYDGCVLQVTTLPPS